MTTTSDKFFDEMQHLEDERDPVGAQDRLDAKRYRWLLKNCTDFMQPVNGGLTDGIFKYKRGSCFSPSEAIDIAMKISPTAATSPP